MFTRIKEPPPYQCSFGLTNYASCINVDRCAYNCLLNEENYKIGLDQQAKNPLDVH